MSVFQSLEDARAYFEKDLFAMENGVVLESVSPGGAVCSLALTARHRNAEGGVMGGAIFTLIDLCFAAAANDIHRPTVAQQVSMNFLSAAKGEKLTAKATCRKDGKTSCVYQVDISDDAGRDVAQAVVTGFKL
jgi:acyl-CoA thioesterase